MADQNSFIKELVKKECGGWGDERQNTKGLQTKNSRMVPLWVREKKGLLVKNQGEPGTH